MDENVKFWIDLYCAERCGILNEGACVEVTFLNQFCICFLLHVTLCLHSCGKMLFYAILFLFLVHLTKTKPLLV